MQAASDSGNPPIQKTFQNRTISQCCIKKGQTMKGKLIGLVRNLTAILALCTTRMR
jgi:hypothetical protein